MQWGRGAGSGSFGKPLAPGPDYVIAQVSIANEYWFQQHASDDNRFALFISNHRF
jgi:hypothetical protein